MQKQNLQTEITMYFHKGTLSVPASPASPSISSTLPSLPFIKVNVSSLSSSSSAYSAWWWWEWQPSWWPTSTQWAINNRYAIQVINYLLSKYVSLFVLRANNYRQGLYEMFLCHHLPHHHQLSICHVEHHVQDLYWSA